MFVAESSLLLLKNFLYLNHFNGWIEILIKEMVILLIQDVESIQTLHPER